MIDSPHRSHRIAFNARNLYQSHKRITCKSKMMLKSHLGSILNLIYRASKKLCTSRSCHSASDTYLSLASNIRP